MRKSSIQLLALLLPLFVACSGASGVDKNGDAGDVAVEDAGETDAGPDAGCNTLDPNCPCPPNFHRCAGRCHFDQDPDFCGASCAVCPNDDYTTGTCDGTQCQVTCKNSGHQCGDRCVLEDGNSCGATCTQCPTAVNGGPACVGGQCAISCASGFSTCGDGRCGAAPSNHCTADGDCCRGTCGNAGVCCAVPGTSCDSMSDCNGCLVGAVYQCVSHTCCVPAAHACNANSDCCSGHCDLAIAHTCVGS